jgi:hypothetical protein
VSALGLQEQIQAAKDKLAQADVDYEGTMAAKLMIARLLFDREGAALLQVCSSVSGCQRVIEIALPSGTCVQRVIHMMPKLLASYGADHRVQAVVRGQPELGAAIRRVLLPT